MAICSKCGSVTEDGKPYCTNCGAPLSMSGPAPQAQQQQAYYTEVEPPRGTRYAPMTIGMYIGTFFLMCIPVANFILLIVWAAGGTVNQSKRNLARAALILYGIGIVLGIVLAIAFGTSTAITDIISEMQV